MSADSFVAYFGVRYTFAEPDDEDTLEELESETDPRMVAADNVGLQHWYGQLTNGDYHFLFIGTQLGVFGAEFETYKEFQLDNFLRLVEETKDKLRQIGIDEEPAIHLQLEAQY